MKRNIIAGLAVVLALTVGANAAISLTAVSISGAPTGFQTYDLVATTGSDWTQSQCLTNLTSGSFYQDTWGSNVSPTHMFVGAFPTLAFDTFGSSPGSFPQAGDLVPSDNLASDFPGHGASASCSATLIDLTWYDTEASGAGTFTTMRMTVSTAAAGTFLIKVSDLDNPGFVVFEGAIADGVVSIIPEPATMTLLVLGGIGMIARKRR